MTTDLHLRPDRENLIVRAFELLHPADGFEFRVQSTIPLSGGFGSSAAGVVAGLVAAESLFELDADILCAATELEGHPDNVAASLLRRLRDLRRAGVARIEPPPGLEAVLVVPARAVRTARRERRYRGRAARRRGAEHRSGRRSWRWGLSAVISIWSPQGLGDRLHQPYRAHLYPRSESWSRVWPLTMARWARRSQERGRLCWFGARAADADRVAARLALDVEGWAAVMRVPFERHGRSGAHFLSCGSFLRACSRSSRASSSSATAR